MENKFTVHLFTVQKVEYLLGRIMTITETLGLNEKQEKAFKDIIKQEIWSFWEHPWGTEQKESRLETPVKEY